MSSTDTTEQRARCVIASSVSGFTDASMQGCMEHAHAILATLAAAGIRLAGEGEVVVNKGRFERVAGDAERWRKFAVTGLTPDGDFSTVQPGDLDPITTQPCDGERCCFCDRCLTTEEIYWYTNQCTDCAGSVQYDDDDPIPMTQPGTSDDAQEEG